MKKINIEFTKEQYLELMKLTYLWEFIVNWHKIEKFDDSSKNLQKYIVEQAQKNKIKDYIDYSTHSKKYWYSQKMEFELYEYISGYVEKSINEELVEIVWNNMVYQKFSEEDIQDMETEKREKIFSDSYDDVNNDFWNNWYSNLIIKKSNPLFM